MLPAHRGRVREEIVRHALARGAQVGHGIGHVGRVPPNDGGDHQVQPRRTILLSLVGAVRDAPLAKRADRPCQCVALLALVQPRLAAPAKVRVFQPVQHEQGALHLARFLQSEMELVLSLIDSELFNRMEGATWPECTDATKRMISLQCSRTMSVLTRLPRSGIRTG